MKNIIVLILLCSLSITGAAQLKIGLLKYNGGGDWYANPTALGNLARYCNRNINTQLDPDYATVEVGSADLFNYPFLHMIGHGNVVVSEAEAENLRNYLMAGGFLHIDDNYGMDPFVQLAIKEVFPNKEFVEIPFDHPIYHQKYDFNNGPPKVHEHDGKPAQGFGILHEGRVLVFYSFESDLGDGWEDPDVHNDPPEVREQALRMGANLVQYAFTQ